MHLQSSDEAGNAAANNMLGTAVQLQSPDDEKEISAAAALHQLKDALSNKPHEDKSALAHVQQVKPELVNDEHMLKFLEVEDLNIDVSSFLSLLACTVTCKLYLHCSSGHIALTLTILCIFIVSLQQRG